MAGLSPSTETFSYQGAGTGTPVYFTLELGGRYVIEVHCSAINQHYNIFILAPDGQTYALAQQGSPTPLTGNAFIDVPPGKFELLLPSNSDTWEFTLTRCPL